MKGRLLPLLLFLSIPLRAAVLDGFESPAPWRAAPADGVSLALSSAEGFRGRALRLDFDFQGHGGYAAAHRELDLDLPENWEITFRVRGESPPNHLEFKLIDAGGQNVWWVVHRDFEVPRDWRTIRIKKRHLQFAWGPAGGGELRHAAALELVVTAGKGGRGWVAFDELTFEPLPPDHAYGRTPAVTASSGAGPERVLDGNAATAWHSAGDGAQWLALDFLERREYGGLVLDWAGDDFATRYAVQVEGEDGAWETVREVVGGNGGRDWISLPESESRRLRLELRESRRGRGYALAGLDVRPLAFSASPNDFFAAIAQDAPRGAYPRYLRNEGTWWAVVGAAGDTEEGLLGRDGALEIGKRGWSVEPFLRMDGSLVDWSDVEAVPALEKGYLPIPTLTWHPKTSAWHHPKTGAWHLDITSFAAGEAGRSVLFARYRLRNDGPDRRKGRLVLAVRPFQVNPSWQFLNAPGGVTEVRGIAWDGRILQVDGRPLVPLTPPAGFGAATFDQGEIVEHLLRGELPAARQVSDPVAHASAALAWDFDLAPGETAETAVAIPFHPESKEPGLFPLSPDAARRLVEDRLAATARVWEESLGRVEVRGPAAVAPLVAAMKSNLAWILIHRDGPAIQPGSRSYERSWIRDGALTSSALLRLGHEPEVREFLAWYAEHQYADGKVPCCVDARGADPVTENDSHGEFLYLIAEHWRQTRDAAFLQSLWPHVEKTVAWIDGLRQLRRTGEYRQPGKRAFFGLLPESISHEGYSSRPVHSYWDDFWALRGLKDAVELAGALGKADEQARWAAIRDEFQADLLASVRQTIADHKIDYIPGSAELGDFDATSTTIALAPVGVMEDLPRQELLRTFGRYWEEFVARRDGRKEWEAYTPYEWRTVGSFLRLAELPMTIEARERAQELLAYFFADRLPPAWNQWPEVVWRGQPVPKFVGDLPHGWVGSDFLRSFLDLFAYERERDGVLVLAAGLPASWVESPEGVAVRGLRTRWGTLDYSIEAQDKELRARIGGGMKIPPGGVMIRWPFAGAPRSALVNGRPAPLLPEGDLMIRKLPAEIVIRR